MVEQEAGTQDRIRDMGGRREWRPCPEVSGGRVRDTDLFWH